MTIAIMGAGAFGTALAVVLAQNGTNVTLWARDADTATTLQSLRTNAKRLPDVTLPDTIAITHDIADVAGCDTVLMAVPMQTLRGVLQTYSTVLTNKTLVACCKGFEVATGTGPSAILREYTQQAAILTGPSFANDIARGLPTALTLAARTDELGQALQSQLGSKTLRLYRTTDMIGAELGGALKNVIAIGCGATIGAGLGDSARAALMTRGYAEMARMAQALGAQTDTLAGLSGFGDLSLTCMSAGSRNYRYGYALGRGDAFDPTITVEGAATAQAALTKAKELGIDMPITAAVHALATGQLDIKTAMEHLLNRPQKEE